VTGSEPNVVFGRCAADSLHQQGGAVGARLRAEDDEVTGGRVLEQQIGSAELAGDLPGDLPVDEAGPDGALDLLGGSVDGDRHGHRIGGEHCDGQRTTVAAAPSHLSQDLVGRLMPVEWQRR